MEHHDTEQKGMEINTSENSLTTLRDSYKSGLYLFGVLKVVRGRPLEKSFWAVTMVLIILFTSFMVYRNAKRYASYDSKTKIWEEMTPERALPVITICPSSNAMSNFFCYNNKPLSTNAKTLQSCNKTKTKRHGMWFLNGSNYVAGKYLGNDCYALNKNRTIKLSVGGEYQYVIFDAPLVSGMVMIFQSQEEFRNRKEHIYLTQFNHILLLDKGKYKIYIKEKHVSSLPRPYMSNCTDGSVESNIFSDKYTYDSCRETCMYNSMYRECNDTIDIWKKYNSHDIPTYNNNTSQEGCIRNFVEQAKKGKFPKCDCARACKESIYTATATKLISEKKWMLFLFIKDAVTNVELVPDYPLESFMGSLGGVLGLSGKIMATLQLMIFLSLCIIHFRI